MFGKALLTFAVVGTVSAAVQKPVIPRWISADKYGSAYVLINNWNGTYAYEGSSSFSWDFDYNCARTYYYSYSTYEWAESSYCNNYLTEYHSTNGCSKQYVGYQSIEQQTNAFVNEFTISWGNGYGDPVWGYDQYRVLEHSSDYTYMYIRPSDGAIEYIVESFPNYQADVVTYFPYGLTVDNTTYGVWDYDLKYGYCADNSTSFSLSGKIFNHAKTFASAKPALEKPAASGKPHPVAADSFAKLGGVRAMFSAKPKAMVAAPSKASFAVNKEVVAEKSPLNLFANKVAPAAADKLKTILKAKPVADERFEKVKSFVATLKPESFAEDLKAEVDEAFAMGDTNRDGLISKDEMRAAIIAEGKPVNEQEIAYIYMLVDANADGFISWNELYNFVKMMSESDFSLYTKAEKTNLVFQYYDSNKDGFLQQAEVKRLLVDSYGYATDADAQWFIALLDANWDGKVSWYELYNAIE